MDGVPSVLFPYLNRLWMVLGVCQLTLFPAAAPQTIYKACFLAFLLLIIAVIYWELGISMRTYKYCKASKTTSLGGYCFRNLAIKPVCPYPPLNRKIYV